MKNVLPNKGELAGVTLATCLILLIPLLAMPFTEEVRWGVGDFLVMGMLLLVAGCLIVTSTHAWKGARLVLPGILLILSFLIIWAELAVGLFS